MIKMTLPSAEDFARYQEIREETNIRLNKLPNPHSNWLEVQARVTEDLGYIESYERVMDLYDILGNVPKFSHVGFDHFNGEVMVYLND